MVSQTSSTALKEDLSFDAVSEVLEKAVNDGAFPGVVALAARNGQVLYNQSFGGKSYKSAKQPEPSPMTVDTVFDLAELTTVVVTTTLLMKAVENGKVRLDDRVVRYLEGFGVLGKSAVTIGHVAAHCSGLPEWLPFFEKLLEEQSGDRRGILTSRGAREYIINLINRMELKNAPGTRQVYSSVGFILLGHLLENLTGLSLDRAAQRYVFQPLGLKSTSFVDLSMIRRRGIHPITDIIAPTEDCQWRKRVLCGEVHDDNAWAMGGIAGHSGLFSTVIDLHIFCNAILGCWRGQGSFLRSDTVRSFFQPWPDFPEGRRLGWDAPRRENGMIDAGLSANAVGLNGFTGCSLWLEPEEGLEIILLSNRVHPSRANRKLDALRPEIYSLMLKALRA